MEVEQHNEDVRGVQRTAERIARGELIRRGGKWTVLSALGGLALGRVATASGHPGGPGSHPVGAIHCENVGFGCDCVGAECRTGSGTVCAKRFGACPSGGYCWTENYGGNNITCCDWTCAGYACHCCRIN